MSIILFFDKIVSKIKKKYREFIFYKKTGSKACLLGDITLNNKNISAKDIVTIYPGACFSGNGKITIGSKCFIGKDTILYSHSQTQGGIVIGNNVCIAGQCYIIDTDHGVNRSNLIQNNENLINEIVIEDDVWIGAGAKILRGTHIHRGAVIGAQSVVKGDIPEYAICVGVPARVIKFRE